MVFINPQFNQTKHWLFNLILVFFICTFFSVSNSFGQTEYFEKNAQRAMNGGEFEKAELLWRKAIANEPQKTKLKLGLSYALYKNQKYVEAYNEAFSIRKSDDQNARAWALTGLSLLAAGNFAAANENFINALALDQNEPLTVAGSGLLDFYQNHSKNALIKMRRAVAITPREPDFIFALAQIAARLEKYKEAADAYKKFLRVAPFADQDRRERIQGMIEFLDFLGGQKSLNKPGGKRETAISCQIIANRPIIEVRLNDSLEKLRFVIDTGAGMTVISEETARRLKIKKIAEGGSAKAIGGDGKFPIVYGFLSGLEMGEVRISNVPVYIRKFYSGGDQIDGYIGTNLISKFLTTLNYRNQTFSLVRQDKRKSKTSSKAEIGKKQSSEKVINVPLRLTSGGFLSGQVKLEGIEYPANFIIDTGAGISVVSQILADEYDLHRFADADLIRVYGAAGITEDVTQLTLPRMTFGGGSQEKIKAAVLDLQIINQTTGFQQTGILGGNFLRNYEITFDFRSANLVFKTVQ